MTYIARNFVSHLPGSDGRGMCGQPIGRGHPVTAGITPPSCNHCQRAQWAEEQKKKPKSRWKGLKAKRFKVPADLTPRRERNRIANAERRAARLAEIERRRIVRHA